MNRSNSNKLFDHIKKLSLELGIPNASVKFKAFATQIGLSDEALTDVGSIVGHKGLPLEYSNTSRSDFPELRVLADCLTSGEKLKSVTYKSLQAAKNLGLIYGERTKTLVDISLTSLLPPEDVLDVLEWRFSVWPAIRCNESYADHRFYVNLHWDQNAKRYLRVLDFLDKSGNGEYSEFVKISAGLMLQRASLIGISFDLSATGIHPAKLHYTPYLLSETLLKRVFKWSSMGEEEVEEACKFLHVLELEFLRPPKNLLLSMGFGVASPSSIKLDVTTRHSSWQNSIEERDKVLCELQDRYGKITSFPATKKYILDELNGIVQYIGLTQSDSKKPVLNYYYSHP